MGRKRQQNSPAAPWEVSDELKGTEAYQQALAAARTAYQEDKLGIDPTGGQTSIRSFIRGGPNGFRTEPDGVLFREPTKEEIKQYIEYMAMIFDVPPALAVAVANQEAGDNFDIHATKPAGGDRFDYGVMQVNGSNKGTLRDPAGRIFQVDLGRVQNDWKYNVYAGLAILRDRFDAAKADLGPEASTEDIARQTYARYNARKESVWRQLYSVPNGIMAQHVDRFMQRYHLYDRQLPTDLAKLPAGGRAK